jgi:hypothetical protein
VSKAVQERVRIGVNGDGDDLGEHHRVVADRADLADFADYCHMRGFGQMRATASRMDTPLRSGGLVRRAGSEEFGDPSGLGLEQVEREGVPVEHRTQRRAPLSMTATSYFLDDSIKLSRLP